MQIYGTNDYLSDVVNLRGLIDYSEVIIGLGILSVSIFDETGFF